MPKRSLVTRLFVSNVLILVLAACGGTSGGGGGSHTAAVKPPSGISSAGKLRVCVDPTYPPMEEVASDGVTLNGFDIDLANGIADQFGVKAEFVTTKFDAIIPALQANKCDAIISALTDNPTREAQVDFVDYIKVGSAFVVAPHNPKNVNSADDLCGKNAAMIIGENWLANLQDQDQKCKAAGKSGVTISQFNGSSDEVQQLVLGRVDAIVTNSVNAAFIAQQNQGKLEIASAKNPFNVNNKLGVGIQKSSTDLRDAVRTAIDNLYKDGSMTKIASDAQMSAVFIENVP